MSAGVIPVVLNRGGVTDIVRHGVTGFLAQSAQEIGETTKEVCVVVGGWAGGGGGEGGGTDFPVPHRHPIPIQPNLNPPRAHPLQVFGMDAASLAQLRSNAISWVERFSTQSFAKNFRVLANRGLLTKPFRHLIQHTGGEGRARAAHVCALWQRMCCVLVQHTRC